MRAGFIASQMRIPFLTKGSLRYCWLPSSGLPHGTGSGSPLQFKFYSSNLPDDATIVIVEGALKATFSLPSTLSCMSSQPRGLFAAGRTLVPI